MLQHGVGILVHLHRWWPGTGQKEKVATAETDGHVVVGRFQCHIPHAAAETCNKLCIFGRLFLPFSCTSRSAAVGDALVLFVMVPSQK